MHLIGYKHLDLVIIPNVSCKQHQDGKHKACEKECTFRKYQVCQVTYRFLLGTGKHRLKAIKVHLLLNALTLRIHLHNVISYASIRYIVQFITNFAEQMPSCCLAAYLDTRETILNFCHQLLLRK